MPFRTRQFDPARLYAGLLLAMGGFLAAPAAPVPAATLLVGCGAVSVEGLGTVVLGLLAPGAHELRLFWSDRRHREVAGCSSPHIRVVVPGE